MQRFNTHSGFLIEEVQSVFRDCVRGHRTEEEMLQALLELYVSSSFVDTSAPNKCAVSLRALAWETIFQVAITECAVRHPFLLSRAIRFYEKSLKGNEWENTAQAACLVRNVSIEERNYVVTRECILGSVPTPDLVLRAVAPAATAEKSELEKHFDICTVLDAVDYSSASCKSAEVLSKVVQDTIHAMCVHFRLQVVEETLTCFRKQLIDAARYMTAMQTFDEDFVVDSKNATRMEKYIKNALTFVESAQKHVPHCVSFSSELINRMAMNSSCWTLLLLVNCIVYGIGETISGLKVEDPEEGPAIHGVCSNITTLLHLMKLCVYTPSNTYPASVLGILLLTTLKDDLYMGMSRKLTKTFESSELLVEHWKKRLEKVHALTQQEGVTNTERWFCLRENITWDLTCLYPSCMRMCGKDTLFSYTACIQLVHTIQRMQHEERRTFMDKLERDYGRSTGNPIVVRDLNDYFAKVMVGGASGGSGGDANQECVSVLRDNASKNFAYASWLGMEFHYRDTLKKIALVTRIPTTFNYVVKTNVGLAPKIATPVLTIKNGGADSSEGAAVSGEDKKKKSEPKKMTHRDVLEVNPRKKAADCAKFSMVLEAIASRGVPQEAMTFGKKQKEAPHCTGLLTTERIHNRLDHGGIVRGPYRLYEEDGVRVWMCVEYRRRLFDFFSTGTTLLKQEYLHSIESPLVGEIRVELIGGVPKEDWKYQEKKFASLDYTLVENYTHKKTLFELFSQTNAVEMALEITKDLFARILMGVDPKALHHMFVHEGKVYSSGWDTTAKHSKTLAERVKKEPHVATSLFDSVLNVNSRAMTQKYIVEHADALVVWLKLIKEKVESDAFTTLERKVYDDLRLELFCKLNAIFVLTKDMVLARVNECIEVLSHMDKDAVATTKPMNRNKKNASDVAAAAAGETAAAAAGESGEPPKKKKK